MAGESPLLDHHRQEPARLVHSPTPSPPPLYRSPSGPQETVVQETAAVVFIRRRAVRLSLYLPLLHEIRVVLSGNFHRNIVPAVLFGSRVHIIVTVAVAALSMAAHRLKAVNIRNKGRTEKPFSKRLVPHHLYLLIQHTASRLQVRRAPKQPLLVPLRCQSINDTHTNHAAQD